MIDDVLGGDDARRLGRRAFLAGTAGAVAGLTVFGEGGLVGAVQAGACFFEPVDPVRLCDTRNRPGYPIGFGYVRLDANTIRVQVAGRAKTPTNARAAVLTVTGVNPGGTNFLTVFPSGERRREVSSVNLAPHDFAVANLVTVKLGVGGAVDIYQAIPCDVIVDVAGVYRPTTTNVRQGRLESFTSAYRALDTRHRGGKPGPGSVVRVNLNGIVPPDAIAVVANLTATDATAGGYVTAYPRGLARPNTSSLNINAGQTRAVGIMTKLRYANGKVGIDLFTERGAHLIVDVAGYITGPSAASSGNGLFVPVSPFRVVDTRQGVSRRVWEGGTQAFTLPAPINSQAQAIAMNLTVTGTLRHGGYFTVYAAQTPRYEVSNLNAEPGETVANHVITRISNAGVACYTFGTSHIIADVFGWFTGSPAVATTPVPYNPPPPAAAPPYIVSIPRLGLNRWVYGDPNPYRIVDAGHTWHWTGTGMVGQGSNIVLFGHRTEHGGPYRYQHALSNGDMLHLLTTDQRRYNYRMVAEQISSGLASEILNRTRLVGGETVSIVSCSKTNRLPTDTRYRLISTFQLTGWDDLG